MRKYAAINDNLVTEILNLEEDTIVDNAKNNQMLIDVEDLFISPQVGWILIGNELKAAIPANAAQKIALTMDMRFKFGNQLADIMVKKMSIKNVALIAAGQVMNINTVIQAFSGIEMALRKCAIPTARGGIVAMSNTYQEYAEEFVFALSEINNYLAIEAAL